jgi:hypothetical protein
MKRRKQRPTGRWLLRTPPAPPRCRCWPPTNVPCGDGSKWQCDICGQVWTKDWQDWGSGLEGTALPSAASGPEQALDEMVEEVAGREVSDGE